MASQDGISPMRKDKSSRIWKDGKGKRMEASFFRKRNKETPEGDSRYLLAKPRQKMQRKFERTINLLSIALYELNILVIQVKGLKTITFGLQTFYDTF